MDLTDVSRAGPDNPDRTASEWTRQLPNLVARIFPEVVPSRNILTWNELVHSLSTYFLLLLPLFLT
jgi:hypothetical protein